VQPVDDWAQWRPIEGLLHILGTDHISAYLG
jgi:hypothetical protein